MCENKMNATKQYTANDVKAHLRKIGIPAFICKQNFEQYE